MPDRPSAKPSPWYVTVLFFLALIVLSPLIFLALVFLFVPYKLRKHRLLKRVQKEWIAQGKFILFIYSDNPEWKAYAEQHIIPKIVPYAIILNWSKKKEWIEKPTLEAELYKFLSWGDGNYKFLRKRTGGQDFNHEAIVFVPWNKPKQIHFWPAWKDHEFGNDEKLKQAEQELFSYLPK